MDAVELTRTLVRIESTNPGTGEGEIGEYILRYMSEAGAVTETCEVEEGRNLVKGMIPGRKQHPALIFLCHMDTVVKGSGWRKDAFGAELSEGKIWGRGSCDMKSGLACALTVFADAAREAAQGTLMLEQPLVFIGTVDEEGDMKGVEKAVGMGWITEEDWVLDMEPTSGTIQMAHKGRAWFRLEMQGVTAHASMPEKGADAIAGMAFAIAQIRRRIGELPEHPELGKTTVTFGQISGGYSPYVVPDYCSTTIDVRLAPPADIRKAEEIIRRASRTAEQEVAGVKAVCTVTGDRPAVETHPESELLARLSEAVEKATGEKAAVRPFPGYTDTAVAAGMTGNKNCMSYGPGNLAQAHKPDEYVEVDDIVRCVSVYRELIRSIARENTI